MISPPKRPSRSARAKPAASPAASATCASTAARWRSGRSSDGTPRARRLAASRATEKPVGFAALPRRLTLLRRYLPAPEPPHLVTGGQQLRERALGFDAAILED